MLQSNVKNLLFNKLKIVSYDSFRLNTKIWTWNNPKTFGNQSNENEKMT